MTTQTEETPVPKVSTDDHQKMPLTTIPPEQTDPAPSASARTRNVSGPTCIFVQTNPHDVINHTVGPNAVPPDMDWHVIPEPNTSRGATSTHKQRWSTGHQTPMTWERVRRTSNVRPARTMTGR